MRVKNIVIVGLVCVNLALLTAVVIKAADAKPAYGQIGVGSAYLMVAGRIQTNYQAVYVIDLQSRQLMAFKVGHGRPRVQRAIARPRMLRRDFRRER